MSRPRPLMLSAVLATMVMLLLTSACQTVEDTENAWQPPEKEVAGAVYAKQSDCDCGEAPVCHNGSTLCISTEALSAHADHGDALCSCDSLTSFFADADGDGYGDSLVTVIACSPPSGYVGNSSDCDDTNAARNPGAPEICNEIDDDCDSLVDDADPSISGQNTYFADLDGDAYGSPDSGTVSTCATSAPSGYVSSDDDCDDLDSAVNPGAVEQCNEIDDDCDGLVDDDDASVSGQNTYYADLDDDGFGAASSGTALSCDFTPPPGYVTNDEDCEDMNAAAYPGAEEIPRNGVDDDCDGELDEVLIIAISSGIDHSIALRRDGTVIAWGQNTLGQLGNGTTTHSSIPVVVSGLTDVMQIAAGGFHNLALKADGTLWAWGYNLYGQIGDGTTTTALVPKQVQNVSNILAIGAGQLHSLVVNSNGTAVGWGHNRYGQLGSGTTFDTNTTPVQVAGLTQAVAITGGFQHSLALRSDGTVYSWGNNDQGQLGIGNFTSRETAVKVLNLTNVRKIAATSVSSFALLSDGNVWAWGHNPVGQLGLGNNTQRFHTPMQTLISGVAKLGGGLDSHMLAVKTNGTVWAWGSNAGGQLGQGSTTPSSVNTPVQVPGLSGIIEVHQGVNHSVALAADETRWAWGDNNYGEIGDGTTTPRYSPVLVAAP